MENFDQLKLMMSRPMLRRSQTEAHIKTKKKTDEFNGKPFGIKNDSFYICDPYLLRTIFDDPKESIASFDLQKNFSPLPPRRQLPHGDTKENSENRPGSRGSLPTSMSPNNNGSAFEPINLRRHPSMIALTSSIRNRSSSEGKSRVSELSKADSAPLVPMHIKNKRSQSVDVIDVQDLSKLMEKVKQSKQYIEEYYWELFTYIIARRQRQEKLELTRWESNFEMETVKQAHQNRETILLRSRRLCGRLIDFNIIKRIGKGAFGEVFLCRRKKTNELLALKRIPKTNLDNKNQIAHVKTEQNVLTEATNQWFVQMFYTFQDSEHIYFAMEYVPGGDLRNFLCDIIALTEDDARFYLAEMFLAVDGLHKLGYIHRDLKPDNFLIDREGHLKLIDFGLSIKGVTESYREPFKGRLPLLSANQTSHKVRREEFKKHRKSVLSLVGSPDYMAFEILAGGGYDFTVDWWSIGCIMYEMLTGCPPFTANTPYAVFANVMNFSQTLENPTDEDGNYLIGPEAWDLIKRLICAPNDRIGKQSTEEIRNHPFFRGVDWDNIRYQKPPFVPVLKSEDDTKYFQEQESSPTQFYQNSTFQDKMKHGLERGLAFDDWTFSKDVIEGDPKGSGGSIGRTSLLRAVQQQRGTTKRGSPHNSGSGSFTSRFMPPQRYSRRTSITTIAREIGKLRSTKSNLYDHPSLAQLSLRDWKVLCTGASQVSFAKDSVILAEGGYNTHLYRIKSGVVRLEKRRPDGQTFVLGTLERNQVFGEMSFVEDALNPESSGEPNVSATVVVESEEVELYKIDRSFILSLFCADKDLFARFYFIIVYMLAEKAKKAPVSKKSDRTRPRKNGITNKDKLKSIETSTTENVNDKQKQKEDQKFRKRFHLPLGEYVIRKYKCSLIIKSKKWHGKLYLGKKHFCFFSRVFGYTHKEVLHLQMVTQIRSIDVDKIAITVAGAEYLFTGFENRDEAFLVLEKLYTTQTYPLETENAEEREAIMERRRSSVGLHGSGFANVSLFEEAALHRELSLSQEDWGNILQEAENITLSEEEVVLNEGEEQDRIFQIASGSCRIEKYDRERDTTDILGYYYEGEMFGEVSFLLKEGAEASIIADEENTEIYVISREYLEKLFEKQPGMAGKFYKFLSLMLARRIRQRELEELLLRVSAQEDAEKPKASLLEEPKKSNSANNVGIPPLPSQ